MQGDFGISLKYKRPVLDVVSPLIGNTLMLGGIAYALVFMLAIALALFCARFEDTFMDRFVCRIGTVAFYVPAFWMGVVLVLVFSVNLKLLPSSGAYGIHEDIKRIDPERCICCSYQCEAEYYCPMNAISWKDKTIDQTLCVACGACTGNCQGGAFMGKGWSPRRGLGDVHIFDRSSPTRNFLMRPASWGVSFYPDTQSLLSEQKATSTQYRRISATGNAAERDSIRPKASGREGPGKKTFSREASPPIPFFLTGNTMPAGRTASPVR